MDIPSNPCEPNPCGLNTLCQVLNSRAVCSCLPDFLGDPQTGCQPECTINSDCSNDMACINMKCVNPCTLGTLCGANAECICSYHTPTCTCKQHYFGNAFIRCYPERKCTEELELLFKTNFKETLNKFYFIFQLQSQLKISAISRCLVHHHHADNTMYVILTQIRWQCVEVVLPRKIKTVFSANQSV